jgi:hypothetical protein
LASDLSGDCSASAVLRQRQLGREHGRRTRGLARLALGLLALDFRALEVGVIRRMASLPLGVVARRLRSADESCKDGRVRDRRSSDKTLRKHGRSSRARAAVDQLQQLLRSSAKDTRQQQNTSSNTVEDKKHAANTRANTPGGRIRAWAGCDE